MSVTGAAKRRRRQFKMGFRHLAKICGGSVKGGRPIYPPQRSRSVADAIARNRMIAAREAQARTKKKK
jgi:hypothetical protein